MADRLPLPTLLSFVLVAFTIEFDNEAEHRMPHSTTAQGRSPGDSPFAPWLVSLVMWANCIRFLGDGPLQIRELVLRARTKTNFRGMHRWGYIRIAPDPADKRPKPPKADWLVRATSAGRMAYGIWQPLPAVIEKRWQKRFGPEAVDRLRGALLEIVSRLDPGLPDCLPILGYGLLSQQLKLRPLPAVARDHLADSPLWALLSRTLLAFASEFEQESHLSLAICANILRVLDEKGVRVRDLPILSGVSKESINMGMGILHKFKLAGLEKDPSGGPWKVVRLTARGVEVRKLYERTVAAVEERWLSRFDPEAIRRLREALEELAGDGTAQNSPLFEGLQPYPDGWRASVRKPATLPHFPMVLHRGGYPDGS